MIGTAVATKEGGGGRGTARLQTGGVQGAGAVRCMSRRVGWTAHCVTLCMCATQQAGRYLGELFGALDEAADLVLPDELVNGLLELGGQAGAGRRHLGRCGREGSGQVSEGRAGAALQQLWPSIKARSVG